MDNEEYLRNRLDRLNQNSHYGIMIDTEITDIVRRHIKRLEENKMKATSVQKIENVKEMHFTIERSCIDEITKVIVGASTNDDIFEFHFSGDGCVVFADQCFNAEKAKGDCVKLVKEKETLKKANTILQKKIKELEEENENLKKHVHYHIDDKGKLIKRNDELREKLALEKAANEAQHKFIREYAGKGTEVQFNYAIDDAKEVSYVIVDKDEYNKNFEKWANAQSENAPMINTSPKQIEEFCKRKIVGFNNRRYDNHILYGRILGYSENAPISTSRADILERAKECVCGHREQDYGTPESNFQLIADMWNDYLFPMLKENKDVISAMDVSMMMALLKIARIRNGGGTGDSFVDLAGYAACGGEIWHEQKVKDQN